MPAVDKDTEEESKIIATDDKGSAD